MRFLIVVSLVLIVQGVRAQWPSNYSPEYTELISFYQQLAKENPQVEIYNMGNSDSGKPIHLIILNGAQDSLKSIEKARSRTTILINNGIHPGEPDGINACAKWVQLYSKGKFKQEELPVIAIIPVYNVGGMLNRNATSRANQNGPEQYGFRGNAQNLDLNRDFIKMDSENAKTFARIFHALNPDVFVDTHVSNGADYQYTLTLIHALQERQSTTMRTFMQQHYFPALKRFSKKSTWDWAPYVQTKAAIPDSGLVAFDDLPRYAQGYAALFHSLSVTVETHMLKPFDNRVQATFDYLDFLIHFTGKNSAEIERVRKESQIESQRKAYHLFNYQMTAQADSILFKGYQASYPLSEVSQLPRLKYVRSKPYQKYIPYYNHFSAQDSVRVPTYYLVSAECKEIIERLKMNELTYHQLQNDSIIVVQTLRVTNFTNGNKPYEGHFLHSQVKINEVGDTLTIPKGSILIPVQQEKRNFILAVLEPAMEDSYFAWNFMDSYVQEKEYFSAYVFEDIAAELLKVNPDLAQKLKDKCESDEAFKNDASKQLFFIYQNSPYFEHKTYMRLPVFKIYNN